MARAGLDAAGGRYPGKLRLAAAVALRPGDFAVELAPGDTWTVLGQVYERNPRSMVPAGLWDVIRTWMRCRGGEFGGGLLPDGGGVNDQAAWLMDAFDMLAGAEAELRKEREGKG